MLLRRDRNKTVFPGDATHPPLWHRDVVAVLPFQITPNRFALVAYVMTYDATKAAAEERYRLTIGGLRGPELAATFYDPHTALRTPLQAGCARLGFDRVGGAIGRSPADAAPGRAALKRAGAPAAPRICG